MFWHAMPPELNTARLMAGAGPAPMLQAATGWEALGNALETQATELAASLVSLKASWTGISSERAIAAATPMVAWLQTAALQAQQRAMQAAAQAASYVKALAMTPSLPEIATNHISHAVLSATNFLGINLVPIGFNETDYFVRMWNQAGGVMDIYQAETAANTVFAPLPQMKPILQPGVGEVVSGTLNQFSEMAAQVTPGALGAFAAAADEVATPAAGVVGVPTGEQLTQFLGGVGQLGQLSGPMQQLMQPLQQLTSLASQTSSMPGMGSTPGGLDALGKPGESGIGQVGLLGAPPLSNHPLAGGSGPSVGLGLMHAEALPGAGGTAARTEPMSQLLDKSGQAVSPTAAGAGAGSSAAGGAAPMGMMGQGAQSAAGARAGLAAPALLGEHHDDDQDGDLHDQDDEW
jgi:PPE-repeat protein